MESFRSLSLVIEEMLSSLLMLMTAGDVDVEECVIVTTSSDHVVKCEIITESYNVSQCSQSSGKYSVLRGDNRNICNILSPDQE